MNFRNFITLILLVAMSLMSFAPFHAGEYDKYPVSHANLWVDYNPQRTVFRIWSPCAEEVLLNFYRTANDTEKPFETHRLEKGTNGVWDISVRGDWNGVFYTYNVKQDGKWLGETPGIYATAVGVNGKRAMVLDLASTNPENWDRDKGPALKSPNAAVIYEMHVRDFTICKNSGSHYPGKFLGLVEKGTKNKEGMATGIDHLKELGITHVHILPAFDFRSIDETALNKPQYAWGYDPQNYNVPEGSYATDPFDPRVRIREFKQMVQGFHKDGIGVIMDVVFNHTGYTKNSNFNLEVPGYYYRHTKDGKLSDATACGNETASERPMMRKFMIESCKYWVMEYHVDGFRFDLMGVHDIETMNLLVKELKKLNPNIIVYGEGWTAGKSPLPDSLRALKVNAWKLHDIAVFNDDLRDGLKGSVFDEKSRGFVSGAGKEEAVKFGIVGAIPDPQINPKLLDYSKTFWAKEPWQSVSYVSCHDNQTLYDKLKASCKGASEKEIENMDMLANTVVLTSQGIPFLQSGVEMLRTKHGEDNSYNKPDSINEINWEWKWQHKNVYEYYKGLIALRKAHPAFFLSDAVQVRSHLEFLKTTDNGVVAFQLKDLSGIDSAKKIVVVFNVNKHPIVQSVPGAHYTILLKDEAVNVSGMGTLTGDRLTVSPLSAEVVAEY